MVRVAALASVLSLVAGCGSFFGDDGMFRDRSEDYKKAPELPVVTLPEGASSERLREIYVIPQVQDSLVLEGEFEVPRPAPLVGGGGAEVVRIQRLGDQSWALIEVAPGQVWPQVRSFLAAAGMQVARADARSGIMESNWVTLEGQDLPSRFRFRIDQGVQRLTSELHVLQMSRTATQAPQDWPPRSDDAEQAHSMLRAVAQYLADSAESAPVSMIAEQGISATGKIALEESEAGYTFIRLELPYDRAWASLGLALERSSFEVSDRDRSKGTYYAKFVGPEEEEDSGWMDWLWNSDEDHPMANQDFLIIMEALDDNTVSIRLRPQAELQDFDKREEQGLLSLIKGNIN
jgi:outer membrane protein assembly factor BamC